MKKVYLVYNVDPKYMDSFLEIIFALKGDAEAYAAVRGEKTNIQEWGVE